MLSKLGFRVEKAENGEDALERIKQHKPDLIMLDNIMPGLTGWDVTKKLKLVGESRWIDYSYSSFNNMTVATDGIVDLRVPMPLDYDDQWVFIIGGEYKLDEHWTLGAGYQYANNPVSASSLCPIGSIIAQHHITVGARYKKDNWWVGGGYIAALPNSMHASGRTRIPFGIDHAVGKTEQVQHSLSVGFGFGW